MRWVTRIATAAGMSAGLMVGACQAEPPATSYTPPATAAPDDRGWETYEHAPVVDAAAAASINPRADTPEAAVVKFLASRARGDEEWKKAMVAEPSDRTKRQLAEWEEWTLESFQLRARKSRGADTVSIKVFFAISFDGRSDEGEDEFEVAREGDGWRVASPPA
ncbi:MAG: hypothetical protein K5872_03905 [Rhizobiaceae bacterium]|nr:hypothetical protein [Rhizobiaceae bacterium]MCV0405356.1 hypothetical protein [Rhizobiaceae bacterium]